MRVFSKNGDYTVRSGYWLLMDMIVNLSGIRVQGDCRLIWKAKILPKAKVCRWQACRDILPMRSNLQSKGMIVPYCYALCDKEVETNDAFLPIVIILEIFAE